MRSAFVNRFAQRGVALLTAMLVVALATVSAVALTSRQQLDIRRTQNMINNDQAYAFLLGAEQIGAWALSQDTNQTDHVRDWRCPIPDQCEGNQQQDVWFPVEGGAVGGHVEDMQGRFNLNNLVADNGEPSALDVQRFRRLLLALELDAELVLPILDWLDANQDVSFPDGAEDTFYLGRERAYRTHGGKMISPSELLLVKGFDFQAYQKLAPYVCTLPERTNINVNTAPAPVIMSLADNLNADEAQALVDERDGQSTEGTEGAVEDGKVYGSVDDFLQHPLFSGRQDLSPAGLDVKSAYFLIASYSQIGRVGTHQYTIVERQNKGGTIQVLYRTQGDRWEL